MNYKYSGHETFPCRYTWLPKAVSLIKENSESLSDDETSIVELGIGKNMVKALRFWIQAMNVAEIERGKGYSITDFGEIVFGEEGVDKFLEDRKTLWLLHWNLLSQSDLFAWDFLFNKWNQIDISPNEVLQAFGREIIKFNKKMSPVTLKQHFNIFLHTYTPTLGKKGNIVEDNLDCPLVELQLIERVGQKQNVEGTNKLENIYTFNRDAKPDITSDLFIYCLYDYISRNKQNKSEISFREIHVGDNCLGQAFKLPETELRERLDRIKDDSNGMFEYKESAQFQKVFCNNFKDIDKDQLLREVYISTREKKSDKISKNTEHKELALAK